MQEADIILAELQADVRMLAESLGYGELIAVRPERPYFMAYQNAKVVAVVAHEIRNAVTISLIHSQ